MNWIKRIIRRGEDGSLKDGNPSAGEHKDTADHGGARAPATVGADNPIRRPEEDVLGRTKLATHFAEHVLSLDATGGVVVAVLGPWGSGKTSFVNLARLHLEDSGIPVFDFNPWMFSGTEQLVEAFFAEISAQLNLNPGLAEVGKIVEEYSECFAGLGWVPVVGPWVERGRNATKGLAKMAQRPKGGVARRRAKVEKALGVLEKPLVVVVDDIDRLTYSEIRDIFKLVRLTASFPNVIYILAFDRVRVEKALAEQGIPGRDYMEKILQVASDLPSVPAGVLNKEVLRAIDSTLSKMDRKGPFDQDRWPDVFMEIIRPLVRNMRDVRRFEANVYGPVRELNGEVALVDVLALEAIRVFLPDVFREIHRAVAGLTTSSDPYDRGGREPHLKAQIDRIVGAEDANENVIRALIERLFPAAERHIGGTHYGSEWETRWRRERRVAHEDVLRFYLERVMGEGLHAFTHAEQAFGHMANRAAFENYLRALDADRLQEVVASLESYEKDFAPEHVVPGAIALLNLLPGLPERPAGMFDLGASTVVGRVVYRLLRSLKNPDSIEAAVCDILPQVSTLSSKLDLIEMVGYREGVGHKLVSEDAARSFQAEWRAQVRAADADVLAGEREILRVLSIAKSEADATEPRIEISDSDRMTHAILQSARSEVKGQTLGSSAIRRSPRLAWQVLIELYGDEAMLCERIEKLKTVQVDGNDELFQLADKYIGGWRPKNFGED